MIESQAQTFEKFSQALELLTPMLGFRTQAVRFQTRIAEIFAEMFGL